MKSLITFLFFCGLVLNLNAQHDPQPSTSFKISGEVKSEMTVKITDFGKWKTYPIGDVIITNHLGEKKSEAKGLKGILLKDVLASVDIASESPKLLSTYYFICTANDGYTVLFSWNELFNNPAGNDVFIVVEKEGKAATAMDESILLISPKDFKTGRRHVKSLASIEVKKVGK